MGANKAWQSEGQMLGKGQVDATRCNFNNGGYHDLA